MATGRFPLCFGERRCAVNGLHLKSRGSKGGMEVGGSKDPYILYFIEAPHSFIPPFEPFDYKGPRNNPLPLPGGLGCISGFPDLDLGLLQNLPYKSSKGIPM